MKTVVVTGGTSGIGAVATQRIGSVPGTRVLLGARRGGLGSPETLSLDLTRLSSVKEFVGAIYDRIGDAEIDALVLNAGSQFPNIDHRTEDGFEMTFGVNHLAHYLLLRLLLPKLTYGATVVITTSDTHDPKINPLAPKQLDPEQLAHPPGRRRRTGFSAGFRAYSASKLCNLLTARGLADSNVAKLKSLTVIAYNPGFTAGTSLFRAWPLWAKVAVGVASVVRPMTRLATVEQAGTNLADLALGRIIPPVGHIYASLVNQQLLWPDPSELARRDDTVVGLWNDSARMVGLLTTV
ncbi:SDR family NAD(P)-dependent oxidoreductase [Paraburkholderia caribensis]|uniref:SDR family NAD(P)-dependent oxidoreductase n=1 Tax=Paraburkholderia caribensis TaxID=75105 RepID=UPI001CB12FF4|nr:SDR family NAD(P)-dependent oxidoreductase [Paraburkholderia caribensis]CAG9243767.1 NAD(P)-dependent dehydrogenase, short-chain alcohol dehydrogenase family [Paraburkholderia caribensis]